MKYYLTILFTFFLVISLSFSKTSKEIDELRLLFYSAVENDKNIDKFKDKLTSVFGELDNTTSTLGIAYWGVYRTLIAKHSFNPYTKLKELKRGLEIMEEAIKKDGSDLEIRFLRFSVLHHLPDFLGYNKEKTEDVQKIVEMLKIKNFTKLDYKFQKGIAEFVIKSQRLDKQDLDDLKNGFLK